MSGISQENRIAVQKLHERFQAPFDAQEAAEVLGVPLERSRRLMRYLADRGWLTRVGRGIYAPVPLAARQPGDWPVDPWIVATRRFDPCYVGGWSALAHHDLTEQIFRSLVVITARKVRNRSDRSQTTPIVLRHRDRTKFFGLDLAWRDGTRVHVSDRERTLIDVLDEPALGGGVPQVAEALLEYFAEGRIDGERLIAYGDRLANRTAFKRLGYLLETLGIGDDTLIAACMARRSAGLSSLDPANPRAGDRDSRWGLKTNVGLDYLSRK
jgi:predicted transcriptional regulator of viral defense system